MTYLYPNFFQGLVCFSIVTPECIFLLLLVMSCTCFYAIDHFRILGIGLLELACNRGYFKKNSYTCHLYLKRFPCTSLHSKLGPVQSKNTKMAY